MSPPVDHAVCYLRRHQALYGDQLSLDQPITPDKPLRAHENVDEQAASLAAFEEEIRECRKCTLEAARTKFVFGVGSPEADMVFVGEAPGYEEDRQGEPFVGKAGKLLDRILAAIQLSRREVYICNILKCRPPNNRDPLAAEVSQCLPYLKEQLRIIHPKLVVALGRVAAKTLLGVEESLKNMRQQVYNYEGVELRVTYHTAALLRNPALKAPAWEDFQAIRDRYRELTGQPPIESQGKSQSAGKSTTS
ncbi:MAG: uracil-DNA glycosylase [Fidelibacterota bacterium]|nr:MAG: uracil-DNA glycosylase [Candidatus Neomarinimicrobiota bacterium]